MSSLQASDLRDDDTVYSNEKALLEMFDPGKGAYVWLSPAPRSKGSKVEVVNLPTSGCHVAYATFKICILMLRIHVLEFVIGAREAKQSQDSDSLIPDSRCL
jgi:hypothetical protein